MRRTLKLLLLLGIGFMMAKDKDGGGLTPGDGDNTVDPATGKAKSDEEREEDMSYNGQRADQDFNGVKQQAKQEAEDGRSEAQRQEDEMWDQFQPTTPVDPWAEMDAQQQDTGDSIDQRDIHGTFRDADREVDVDRVWDEGDPYYQRTGELVRVLSNGDGTYQVVVRDPSNPSGLPVTVMEALTQSQLDSRLRDGRWNSVD